jgi:D-sedoheptulose 7-phosphate isomerase
MQDHPNAQTIFHKAVADHLDVIQSIAGQQELVERIALAMSAALVQGKKILWCGNGGSAADAQHMAAEIVGRFRRERRGLPSIALTTDTSILTAVANDYGYEAVFSRQVEALGNEGDVLVAISTSGNSPNVVKAVEMAKELGLVTVGFTGAGGGRLATLADFLFAVPTKDTARVQEAHSLVAHVLCDWVELDWVRTQPVAANEGSAL